MADFMRVLDASCKEQLDKLAKQVQRELKAAVLAYKPTTKRADTIFIEETAPHKRFVGTEDRGLYFLDQGSAPVEGKHMAFKPPNDWVVTTPLDKRGKVHITRRRGFNGIHFVRQVADRHR